MGKVVKTVVGVVTTVVGVVTGNPALIIQGVSMTFSAVTEKKPKQATSQAAQQRLSKSLTPEVPRKIVLGKTAFPTDLRYWEVYGAKYTNYVEVMAAATHRVHSFGNLYIDEAIVPFSGTAATGKYAGALKRYTRTQGVSGQGMPLGSGARWNTSASMTGCAYWVLDWTWTQEKLPNGIPSRYTQEGEGSPVYDPRRDSTRGGSGTHRADNVDTWEYAPLDSNGEPIGRNNALQMLRILIGWRINSPQTGEKVLVDGRGVNLDDINYASFIEAANDCELERWYSDCVLSTGDSHSTNEGILEAAAGGKLADTGGRWSYRVATNDTANIAVQLTDDDFEGLQFEWKPRRPMSEQFNEIAGTYIDPAALYQARPFPLVYDPAYYAADGFKKRTTVSLSAVQDSAQAQKLMRIKLNAQRRQGVFRATFNWKPLLAENLDCVTLTFAPLGFVNKLFRVIEMGLTPNGVDLTLQEEDGAVYLGGTIQPYAPPSSGVNYDSSMKVDVGLVTFTAWGINGANGAAQDAARLTWPVAPENVRYTEVRYRVNGTTPWTLYSGGIGRDHNVVIIGPLLAATAYDFEVRHTSVDGVPGEWSPESGTTNAVTRNSAGQIVYADGTPIDSLRPAEAGSNITENRTAAAFQGQGQLATQNQVTWATQVTGVGRPEDYSTRSRVFRQQPAPTDPNTNDIWVVTDGAGNPLAVRAWNGSGWVTGADLTGLNTAAAIVGQGWGATASEQQARNSLIPVGVNRIVNSDLAGAAFNIHLVLPKPWRPGWSGNVGLPINWSTGTVGGRNTLRVNASGTPAPGLVFDNSNSVDTASVETLKRFGTSVKPGDRVGWSARVASQRSWTYVNVGFLDVNGAYITEFASSNTQALPEINGNEVNPANWHLVTGIVTAPAGAVFMYLWQRVITTGSSDPYGWMSEPMLAVLAADQTVVPTYALGPNERLVDRTNENVAAGFTGQDWGATASEEAAANARSQLAGPNLVRLSRFQKGRTGHFGMWQGGNGQATSYIADEGGRDPCLLISTPSQIAGAQHFGAGWHGYPSSSWNETYQVQGGRRYCSAVRGVNASDGRGYVSPRMRFYSDSLEYLGEGTYVVTDQSVVIGGYAYFYTIVDAPAGATKCWLENYVASGIPGYAGSSFYAYDRPCLRQIPPTSTLFPGYVDGPNAMEGSDQTGLNTAAAIVGQTVWATASQPISRISRLRDNGRLLNTYVVSNGVLTGTTLVRNPVYVVGSQVNGSAAQINVAAHTLKGSGISVSYAAGSISGLAFQTTYYVWAYDPDVVGGAVTYVATTDPNAYIDNADYLFISNIRTVASGGGTPAPAPPPPMPPGYTDCVQADAWLPTLVRARDVEEGDPLLMLRADGEAVEAGRATANRLALAHCMIFTTVSGITLTCSSTTPILFQREGEAYGAKPAWECDGSEVVPVLDADGFRWEPLAQAPGHIGQMLVAHISASDGVYAAGDERGRFIFTHNIRMDQYVKP